MNDEYEKIGAVFTSVLTAVIFLLIIFCGYFSAAENTNHTLTGETGERISTEYLISLAGDIFADNRQN